MFLFRKMQILYAQCSFPRYMLTQPDRFDVALLHLDRPVFYQVPFHYVPFFFTSLRPRLSKNVLTSVDKNFTFSSKDNIIPVCLPPGDISLDGKNKNITSTSWHNWCFGILHLHLFVILLSFFLGFVLFTSLSFSYHFNQFLAPQYHHTEGITKDWSRAGLH